MVCNTTCFEFLKLQLAFFSQTVNLFLFKSLHMWHANEDAKILCMYYHDKPVVVCLSKNVLLCDMSCLSNATSTEFFSTEIHMYKYYNYSAEKLVFYFFILHKHQQQQPYRTDVKLLIPNHTNITNSLRFCPWNLIQYYMLWYKRNAGVSFLHCYCYARY